MRNILILFCLFFVVMFSGCGKGYNQLSINANAGDDQSIFVNLQCELDGSASTGTIQSYSWTAKKLPPGVSSITISASNEQKAFFTPTSSGVYQFELKIQSGTEISSDIVTFTAGAFVKPTIASGFFGVCAHLQSHDATTEAELDRCVQAIHDIGAQFVRFDFAWEDIEPVDDQYDFSKYDLIVSKLLAENIKIVGVLGYGNIWSDPTTGEAMAINKFADFVYQTSKHFKTEVNVWEIWNEPNNPLFWSLPDAGNYTKLLKASYGAVKQAAPNAVVVLGGLFGNGKDAVYLSPYIIFATADFLDDIYSAGGKNYFDVVSIHPYDSAKWINSTSTLESSIAKTKVVMSDNGDSSKELWLTELGPYFFPPVPVPLISTVGFTESQEATWVNLIYSNLDSACDKLFYYELRDYPSGAAIYNPNWEGLVYSDFRTKESYEKYKNFSK